MNNTENIIHEVITDKVNVTNACGFALSLMLKPLTNMHFDTLHSLSVCAKDLTPIIGTMTAVFLFLYNVKKFYNEFKKK